MPPAFRTSPNVAPTKLFARSLGEDKSGAGGTEDANGVEHTVEVIADSQTQTSRAFAD
jgi:hypothetical protein